MGNGTMPGGAWPAFLAELHASARASAVRLEPAGVYSRCSTTPPTLRSTATTCSASRSSQILQKAHRQRPSRMVPIELSLVQLAPTNKLNSGSTAWEPIKMSLSNFGSNFLPAGAGARRQVKTGLCKRGAWTEVETDKLVNGDTVDRTARKSW